MLTIDHVSRRFGDRVALDDVTFDVRPGRLTGFVGANGAGKTTTMRIVLGVLAASSGQVLWDGEPLTVEQRARFGYMPEERGLYPKMRVAEQIAYFGRLRGLGQAESTRRTRELLGRLGLSERADDVLESLSLGNQQRAQIAASLVHGPTALVLDEPFSGLDPLAVDAMADLLRDEITPEMPVLFSSHQLELIERLCDDLVILSAGALVAAGAVDELRGRGDRTRRLVLADGADAGWVRDVPGVSVSDVDGRTALVEVDDSCVDDLLRRALDHGGVREFSPVRVGLSEIFKEAIHA